MHEVTVAKNILDIVLNQIPHEGVMVNKIILEIGALAAIDNNALKFGFGIIAKNTMCDGAILEIMNTPAKVKCDDCGQISTIDQYGDACAHCSGYSLTILEGEELSVKSMEIS